jgi:Ala-tRNA(Pro) deacylase
MNTEAFLHSKNVSFEAYLHEPTYGAQHLARELNVSGRLVAKTVLLHVNGGFKYLVAVLPATYLVDLDAVSKAFGGARVKLATEDEIAERCPDCERGVLSPFGSRYALETVVDPTVVQNEQIVFEGNTHGRAIRMLYRDFYELEHPLVLSFSRPTEPAVTES